VGESPVDRAAERMRMVNSQIESRGVQDPRVLRAMREVPRHAFVPPDQKRHAYDDRPLRIGHGQTISQPFIVGFMTAALELDGTEKVLEIGTGSGYQAAVLAEVAGEVFTIEIVEPLARRAAVVLDSLGYERVRVRVGDGYRGWPEQAPFDAIMVTAAPSHIPEPLLDQLAMGGLLILPVGGAAQDLVRVRKTEAGLMREKVLPVRFVPMTGEARGES